MLRKALIAGSLLCAVALRAETGYDAWLRYAALDDAAARQYRAALPGTVTALGDSVLVRSARSEERRVGKECRL